MFRRKYKIILFAILIASLFMMLSSCDSNHGIAPKPIVDTEFGFGGNIIFYGEWPDSIKRMFLVIFKDPLLDESDFVLTNMGYLSFELPLQVQSIQYNSSLDSAYIPLIQDDTPPSIYHYVAVAQQSTEEVSLERKDWFVTGIYYVNGDTTVPGILTIPEDAFVEDINIYCDFDNPPTQPPGGN